MAEHKHYIVKAQQNGRVMISEDVVATIAVHSLADVEGFAGFSTRSGNDVGERFGRKQKSIRVNFTDNDEILIECNVLMHYGQSVGLMAKKIQAAISGAVESTTGIKVIGVNVNVCGVVRK